MSDDKKNKADKGEKKAKFTIFVNNNPYQTSEHELTGAQIKVLAGVPNDYELFHVKGDETVPVGNDQSIKIHDNEHFRAIPAGTFGMYDATAEA